MCPELWLYDLAWERQREMREFAARSAQRGIGEEYSALYSRSRATCKCHLYLGHLMHLWRNWARRDTVLDARAGD